MRKKFKWQWENLDANTWRAKVVGGWLFLREVSTGKDITSSMVFVSDRDHEMMICPDAPE